jgi:hypothetical protein
MRLQPTAQLAAKKHASSFASLAMPAQKSRIIQAFLAPAMLGAPEALAVGWLNCHISHISQSSKNKSKILNNQEIL